MTRKININGIVREMTAEEVAELERLAAEMPQELETTTDERLDEIEAAIMELAELLTEVISDG